MTGIKKRLLEVSERGLCQMSYSRSCFYTEFYVAGHGHFTDIGFLYESGERVNYGGLYLAEKYAIRDLKIFKSVGLCSRIVKID